MLYDVAVLVVDFHERRQDEKSYSSEPIDVYDKGFVRAFGTENSEDGFLGRDAVEVLKDSEGDDVDD